MSTTVTQQSCPSCGTALPVLTGYVTWCHACGWNLTAPADVHIPQGRLGRLHARVGKRLGDRLVDELVATERLAPRMTPSKAFAYGIAVGVYAAALAAVGGGVALLVVAFPNPFAIVVGLLLVGIGVLMRPRFGRAPDENLVPREEAPELHALVDEVAAAIGTARIDLLHVEPEFNASWSVVGLRRTRVLALGLPLLTALEPHERVALIAHELAHDKNGDSSRSFFMGSAVRALEELYVLLAPDEYLYEVENPDLGPIERIANMMLWVVSRPVLGLLLLQLHLLLRDSQRAEYLADALAARVAGTGAVVALQEKLLLAPTFQATVQSAARPGAEVDLFDALAAAVVSVPERERERRRRAARLEEARFEATHPPTAKRIELLERRPAEPGIVVLDEQRSRQIDSELARHRTAAAKALIDEYRDSLYAH